MTVTASYFNAQRSEQDDRYTTSHVVTYLVESDDRDQEALSILSQATSAAPHPVPLMWAPYALFGSVDTGTYVRRRSVERIGESSVWRVTVEYRPPDPTQNPTGGDNTPNPLARPVVYWAETETFTEEAVESANDPPVPIVNSAHQRFRDPVEKESTRAVLVARRNVGSLTTVLNLIDTHALTTNDDTYRSHATKRWLVRSIRTSEPMLENEILFYQVTFRLVLRENGLTWDVRRPDTGLMHAKAAGDPTLVHATDGNGVPVAEEVPLNADGTRAAAGTPVAYIDYPIYPTSDFDAMGV